MSSSALFTPLKLGNKELKHRVVLAPLTRKRANKDHVPNEIMQTYYSQRASDGGLLISEGTVISKAAGPPTAVPGIYSKKQIKEWKKITEQVHSKGGIIYIQLYHPGRAATSASRGGLPPLSSSGIPIKGNDYLGVPYEVPRALTISEIEEIIEEFKLAALNAIEAGFDGVEIHSANGYLLDEFVNSNSNKRTDIYGGSIENRSRFTLQVTDAVVAAIGAERTAVRFSPFGVFQEMGDETPYETWGYLTERLQAKHPNLAYLHFIEPRGDITLDRNVETNDTLEPFRKIWKGPFISAGPYTHDLQLAFDTAENSGNLVAFGRLFISNPDLVERLRHGWPLNKYNRKTFYTPDETGYTDYPFYKSQ